MRSAHQQCSQSMLGMFEDRQFEDFVKDTLPTLAAR